MQLGPLDVVVLGLYFGGILAVGLWFGRGERNTHDFFLGGRRQHWLIVGLSLIATEASALTFLIVPGRSFQDDCWYLQMYAGSFVGRVLIVYTLLPAFYAADVTTVYEYLGQRFGPWTRATASLLFVASRIVGSGIRLMAASLAIALVFDWPLTWVVIGGAGIAIVYTTFGGIKAIIWTDALQAIVFLGGALAAVLFLFSATPGSCFENLSSAYQAGKFHTFTWSGGFNNDKVFWVLVAHTIVQTMAAFGADQDLTQRMLTCPDLRRGQRSLLFNAFAGLPVVCLFLLIGALMYVYYQAHPEAAALSGGENVQDRIFAHFIATAIPSGSGLKGLLVAGIFAAAMSSLDSALGALSSTAVTDFYRPYVRPHASSAHYVRVARWLTFFFGLLLALVALSFAGTEDLLKAAFGWVSLIFGGMLGVFLLGVLTRNRGADRVNVVAMLSSLAVLVAIKFLQERQGAVWIAWPWWVVIGTAWTVGLGACFRTSARDRPRRDRPRAEVADS
ncbi:MAG: sodium/solute symporter [Planctomycetes bacterium]|nr:sodium/solute symporter [Planctomycetota bacterium]